MGPANQLREAFSNGLSDFLFLAGKYRSAAAARAGVHVVERVPCEVVPSPHAEEYLKTKKEKLGHLFS